MNKNNKNRLPNKKWTPKSSTSCPSDATSYSGPVELPSSFATNNLYTRNHSFTTLISANSSGVVDLVYTFANATSVANWSALSATFHEYRVLGMKLEFQPLQNFTSAYPPLIIVSDRLSTATLGSYAVAADHESAQLVPSRQPFSRTIRASSVDEMGFLGMASATQTVSLKFYGDQFTSNQQIGRMLITYLTQFRSAI